MKSNSRKVNRETKRQKNIGKSQQQNGENRYAVFDRMLEGVQVLGHYWRYLYLNAAAEKHNRRPNRELLGNKYMDMWPGIEETHVFSVIKHCLEQGEPSELENRFVYPDGVVGWFTLSIQPVPEGVLILSFDITEQVQTKNALHKSEEHYRKLTENFPNGTVNIYDRDLRMTFVAGGDLKKYNMDPEAFIGRTFQELAPSETFSIAEPILRAAFEGKAGSYETPYWNDRYYLVNVAPLASADGSIHEILVVTQNLTERKQMEDSLRKTQEQLILAIRSANVGLWDWDLQTNKVNYSPEWKGQLGYEDHEVSNDFSEWESRVHPEDLERAKKTINSYLEKPYPNYFNEFRMQHKDGSYRWILAQASLIDDGQGNPVRMIGSHIDITERVRAEEQLHESQMQLEGVIDSAMDAIITLDADQRIILFNPAAEKIFRCPADEALGQPLDRFIPKRFREIHREHIRNFGKTDQTSRSMSVLRSLTCLRSDGEEFPAEITISQTEMSGRKIYTAILRDVTMRAQAQKEITNLSRFPTENPNPVLRVQNDGQVIYANKASQELLDMWGCELHDYLPTEFKEIISELAESGVNKIVDIPCNDKVYAISLVPVSSSGYVNLYGSDVTKRKRIERALVENEQRFRGLIDHAPDGIVIYGSTGRIEYASPATEHIMGYATEEILATDPAQITHPDDLPELEEALAQLTQTPAKTITAEYRMRHKDGSWRWLESHISNFSDVPGINGLVFNFRDISERKVAGREIQKRTEDLLLINTLNDAANRGEDFEGIVEVFAREIQKVFDCLAVAVYLLSPDAKYIEMQSNTIPRNLIDKIEKLIGRPLPRVRIEIKEGSLLKQILENEDGSLLNDPKLVQQWIEEYSETTFLPRGFRPAMRKIIPRIYKILKIGSAISVPLVASGRTIGILELSSRGQFNEEDLERIRTISFQVTAVLMRKQIEKQVELQLQRMRGLSNIDRAISSSLDMRISLEVLLTEVLSQLEVDAAAVLLLKPSSQMLEFVAGKGFRSPSIRQSRVRLGEGFAGQVGMNREMLHFPDFHEAGESFTRAELLSIEEFVDYIAVPLVAKGTLKGVLEIYHRAPLEISPDWKSYLETLSGQAAIAIDSAQLFEGMQKSNQELIMAYDATITGWSRAMDLRDQETEGHTQRVTNLTMELAEKFGISRQEQVHIRRGALLHDIGKLGVPDSILLKPGKLTEEEWELMRQHPKYAYEMLMPIAYLRPALDIPYCHHEKWDGSGYPRGLKGEQIPLAARIFAVIDVWDALTSDRPYRSAWTHENALEYIKEQSGYYFDPDVVDVFLDTLSRDNI